MPRSAATQVPRRTTNIALPTELLEQARECGLDVSQVCERGLRAEIAESRAARWIVQNRDALLSSNEYVERHGLPLSEYRQF